MDLMIPLISIILSVGSLLIAGLSYRTSSKLQKIEEIRVERELRDEHVRKNANASITSLWHDNEGPGPQIHADLLISPPKDGFVLEFHKVEVNADRVVAVDFNYLHHRADKFGHLSPPLIINEPVKCSIVVHQIEKADKAEIKLSGVRHDDSRTASICKINIPSPSVAL